MTVHKMVGRSNLVECDKTQDFADFSQLLDTVTDDWEECTCEECRIVGGMTCKDEGCPHYGKPHVHVESQEE